MKKVLFFLAALVFVASCKKSDSSSDPEPETKFSFSVSEVDSVIFAKTNIQYQASTDTWRFAENPWDYVGYDNDLAGASIYRDLFGWRIVNSGLPTPEGTTGNWRALTRDEWDYVAFYRKTKSGSRFVKAQVNEVNGVILFPNEWDNSIYTLDSINYFETLYKTNVVSASTWQNVFEPTGSVFLPAGGNRYGTEIELVGEMGGYWSSTRLSSGNYAFYFMFDTYLCSMGSREKTDGLAFRLVANKK